MNNFEQHSNAFVLFLDECLKTQGKNRSWLAKQTGISEGRLSLYFNLKNSPTLPQFLRMLHALKINIFFQTQDSNTDLNKEFERAMERLGRRPDKLNKN